MTTSTVDAQYADWRDCDAGFRAAAQADTTTRTQVNDLAARVTAVEQANPSTSAASAADFTTQITN